MRDELEVCTSMVLLDDDGYEYDADVVLIVRVDTYNCVQGSYSYNAASDMDYHGYEEIEYTIMECYFDDGEDTKVPFTDETFNNPKDIEKIEEAIREFSGDEQ